jgi:hypothetical protein
MVVANRETKTCVSFLLSKACPTSSPLKWSITQEEDNHSVSPQKCLLTQDEVNHNDSAPLL